MFKRILLCTDGSERSIQAAAVAAHLAAQSRAQVTLLHICPVPEIDEPFVGAPSFSQEALSEYVNARNRAVIERTAPALESAGIEPDVRLELGNPVEIIARTAENQDFDLVVMGSRARKTDSTSELGSVSFGVVQRVHCPVLIVK